MIDASLMLRFRRRSMTTLLLPLYVYPQQGAWNPLYAAKAGAPGAQIMAVVNPHNGPGAMIDPVYTSAISGLDQEDIVMAGYVSTLYGKRELPQITADVESWKSMYPQVDCIFLDEMSKTPGDEGYYSKITSFCKQLGYEKVIGNPGTDIPPSFISAVDSIIIYENYGYPLLEFLDGWHSRYPKNNFGFIAHYVQSLDASFLEGSSKLVEYIGISGAYEVLPNYLSDLVALLASLVQV
jgi:hypothetical protein